MYMCTSENKCDVGVLRGRLNWNFVITILLLDVDNYFFINLNASRKRLNNNHFFYRCNVRTESVDSLIALLH